MVAISREMAAETEARLRQLFRRCAIDWLPGWWTFREGQLPPEHLSIARVRDEARLSALGPCPFEMDEAPRFGVFRVVLPDGEDDSGFVGWLASWVKARTGSGLFVVCGQDSRRGGIFDYYGIPEAAVDDVKLLLNSTVPHGNLDGVVMTVRDAAPGASVDRDTIFCFDQDDATVTARYGGGGIRDGWLAGTISPSQSLLQFDYVQVTVSGRVESGRSNAELAKTADGRWTLTEQFLWATREGGGTNHLEESTLIT
jgi:hypothetical protein